MAKSRQQSDANVITYAHYGDWIAVWHNDKQIHFHDTNFAEVLHKISKAVSFEVQQLFLDISPDNEEENDSLIDGVTLTELKEQIADREAERLKCEIATKEAELDAKRSKLADLRRERRPRN